MNKLVQEYKNGKTMKQIMNENPNISRSTLYYHIRSNKNNVQQHIEHELNDELNTKNNSLNTNSHTKIAQNDVLHTDLHTQNVSNDVLHTETHTKIAQNTQNDSLIHRPTIEQFDVQRPSVQQKKIDSFLGGYRKKDSEKLTWDQENLIDQMFGNIQLQSSNEPEYDPDKLANVQTVQPEKPSKFKLNFWQKNKTKKQLDKDEVLNIESERLETIQKIRLYIMKFPELENLHIIKNDKDKFIYSLYTKKQGELDKTLHFIQFHCRNNSNENTAGKMSELALTTILSSFEYLLCSVGMKVKGLSNTVMQNPNIERTLNELMIEHNINTMNISPVYVLMMTIGGSVLALHTKNTIEDKMNNKMKNEVPIDAKKTLEKLETSYDTNLVNKYEDL